MVATIVNDLSSKFEPSNLTAFERYQILAPILTKATNAYMRLFTQRPTASRNTRVRASLNKLFADAARNTPMSEEEVRRSFQGFTTLGMAGLMSPIPLSAKKVARSFQGTWEMRHRFTNGGRTPSSGPGGHTNARSTMYYDLTDAEKCQVTQLTVMWTEENHYPREEAVKRFLADRPESDQTFLLASLAKIQLNQIDDYTVEFTDDAEIIGNHGDYQNRPRVKNRTIMMRFGGSESLLGVPDTRFVHPDGREEPVTGTFLLMNAHGAGPSAFSWIMSGLPPMFGDQRSMDTVDTYLKMSEDKPLVAGWEPIESYYNRLRDPNVFASNAAQLSARSQAPQHGFHPESIDRLRTYKRDYDY